MSSRQIRRFTYAETDYAAQAALLKVIDPTPVITVEKLKFWDSLRNPKFRSATFFVDMDGQAVAIGSYEEWPWWYEPGRYLVHVGVHPAFRRQGIGAALYDHLMVQMADEEPKGTIFMGKCWEAQPESVRFITQRGFVQTGREQMSELDVQTFDMQPFADVAERMRQQGITILPYPELAAADPLCQRKCYAMQSESMVGMPKVTTQANRSCEQYVQQVFGNSAFIPEAFFIALDQGRYVGLSALCDEHEDRTRLATDYTGVIPSHRRRGIATALKLCCIQYAQAHGARTITTGNDSTNPMYQINVALGFKPAPAELLFEMKLASTAG
ncbi:MAG: GNAT family N-acetyltransferase [Caldilineaceae bacterium]